ncbi:carbamoyltransferase C-terminal domain-containing protein [Telmatospirillum sp.]|uniref:carbamoyltransferase C-terminal domain-containing protein n=1 Tax=Telmatospirillum sp. TaxID=2079197 RepID=UPI00284C7062|nr:carbamoyltransferase C-terminal domain-containing protein [Telmatospirillum sp.]MDR3435666.1 carbamoyltransferase C-terminal domain-containing protein [Telmatospirillum sp.]
MIILSLHSGLQDSGAALFEDYTLLAAVQQERLTRRKGDGGLPSAAVIEALTIAGLPAGRVDALVISRGHYPLSYFHASPPLPTDGGAAGFVDLAMTLASTSADHPSRIFNSRALLADLGLPPGIPVFFANHHRAHALSALFHTDWDRALIYTADGGGDNVHYSHHLLKDGQLACLFGDDRWLRTPRRVDSLGQLYGLATEALGFRANRHEGKLTGLAGYGQATIADDIARHFSVDDGGLIGSDFASVEAMGLFLRKAIVGQTPEDAAASVQAVLERVMSRSIECLLDRHDVRRLALAGGVFANVRLNRCLAGIGGIDEIFIFPGMGDEGLPIGGALDYLLTRDGLPIWLTNRRRLDDVFWGQAFDQSIDSILEADLGIVRLPGEPAEVAAGLLAQGLAGAIFAGRSEFGPRALGNRSILASPADAAINQRLNARLKRSEFMPFAPCVRAEDAAAVFDITPVNAYACRFMTITTSVREAWKARIPAVVHVDGTARPQIVIPDRQPLYADILRRFKAATGLPVLVNTSFNAHEEPIINRPEECLQALLRDRVDFVVTPLAVYRRACGSAA